VVFYVFKEMNVSVYKFGTIVVVHQVYYIFFVKPPKQFCYVYVRRIGWEGTNSMHCSTLPPHL